MGVPTEQQQRRGYYYDTNLLLRDTGTPISDSTDETAIEFAVIPNNVYKAVVHHTGVTGADGANYWSFQISVGATSVGPFTTIADTGATPGVPGQQIEIPLGGKLTDVLAPGSAFIRVSTTKVGTVGDLDYGCFLSPNEMMG